MVRNIRVSCCFSYALLLLMVIMSILGKVSTLWGDLKPSQPSSSYVGSSSDVNRNRNSVNTYETFGSINHGSSDQSELSKHDQTDEMGKILGKLGEISASLNALRGMNSLPDRTNSFQPPKAWSMPSSGGSSSSSKPGRRSKVTSDQQGMENSQPSFQSGNPSQYGTNHNSQPSFQSQNPSQFGTNHNSQPTFQSGNHLGTPASSDGSTIGWFNVSPDGQLTPAPEGEGFLRHSYSTTSLSSTNIKPNAGVSGNGYNSQPPNPSLGTLNRGLGSFMPLGALMQHGNGGDDTERFKAALLGLLGEVDDGADDIGPPVFNPVENLKPSHEPSETVSNPYGRPVPVRPDETTIGEPQRLKPHPKPSPFKPITPEGVGPIFPPSLAPSSSPGASSNDSPNRPRTPNGKPVGRSKGKQIKIIDGRQYVSESWELNAKEILEMDAKPQGDITMLGKFSTDPSNSILATYQGPTENDGLFTFYESAYKNKWNDPLWSFQWYMHDYRTKDVPVMDMNVVPAWELGYTGKNIKIAVVDDGVMHGHPDLAPNHLEYMSYDYSINKPGSQPSEPLSEHSHGTKCASEIAMVAGNGLCGVGMAYDAKIAGVRNNVGQMTTEFVEGKTLVHKLEEIDISSNSYGPKDDGISMQRAPHLAYEAFLKGVTEGRGGRGQVYVFPAGNGRKDGDHCGADCYMNTRYTIGIASASQRGKLAYYSERCTGIMATSYSSGDPQDEKVVTVEMDKTCNDTFGGTSAAVPHATAVVALILQANPELTYRDVMHIITMGTEVAPLADNENTWKRNGAGFWVSHDFGFGLLNAKNMVLLAENWRHVPVEHNSCEKTFPITYPIYLSTGKTAAVEVYSDGCPGDHSVQWIENVELEVTIHYSYRGALSISLTSPYGTVSELLETRERDNENGMRKWIFRTVHHWGETPNGRWVLKVTGNPLEGLPAISGSIDEAIISFHGMASDPPHQSALPRTYAAFRLPDGRTNQDKLASRERTDRYNR